MDSIRQSPFLHKITLVNKDGETKTIKSYLKRVQSVFDIPESEWIVDEDRMYAFVNDDHDLVLIQYYIFDKILKDVNYYVAGNPIQYQIEHYQIEE